MARDGGVSCLRRSEMMTVGIGGIDSSPLDSDEVHVLAVDDSLVDRIVIERLLRVTSCKVTAVDSGWRALEFLGLDNEKDSAEFNRLKVDLIITDYCMPGMTGYELLKKIKESSDFCEVPVVIMSSENVLTRIDRCLEEGAEDFLLKPVKLADVKRLRNHVKLSHGIKRKIPEDSDSVLELLPPPSASPLSISLESSDSSPPLSISLESSDSSPPPSPLSISLESSDSSPPPSPLSISLESSDSSPPPSPLSISLVSSDSSPPPSPLSISLETSESSPLISPVEMLSATLSSLIEDEDDDILTSSTEYSSTAEESPIRRQKMISVGLD